MMSVKVGILIILVVATLSDVDAVAVQNTGKMSEEFTAPHLICCPLLPRTPLRCHHADDEEDDFFEPV